MDMLKNEKLFLTSWVNNLSIKPLNDDIKVIKSILENKAEIGIVNSYYLAKLLKDIPNITYQDGFFG